MSSPTPPFSESPSDAFFLSEMGYKVLERVNTHHTINTGLAMSDWLHLVVARAGSGSSETTYELGQLADSIPMQDSESMTPEVKKVVEAIQEIQARCIFNPNLSSLTQDALKSLNNRVLRES